MSTLQRKVFNVALESCSVYYGQLFTVRQRKAHTETYPISDDPLFQIGAEQLPSVTETAPKSPFLSGVVFVPLQELSATVLNTKLYSNPLTLTFLWATGFSDTTYHVS